MNKLLLEEMLFEDAADFVEVDEEEIEETPVEDEIPAEDELPTEDEPIEPEITDDNLDQVVADAEGEEVPEEPTTTTYKVTFTLGKHTNWSRVDATDEEDAKQQVTDYVTRKWPDRGFEITDVDEFEEMEESLNESLGEVTDAQPIEDGASVGMASVISDLIKDEYEAIDGYNSAIATAEAEGFTDMVKVLTEIQAEENLHIGQLQAIMNTIDPNAHLVDDGQAEGIEQLANPLSGVNESLSGNDLTANVEQAFQDNTLDLFVDDTLGDGSATEEELLAIASKSSVIEIDDMKKAIAKATKVTEDLDDMNLQDQRMFIRCVNEIWDMSVIEWTQKYYEGLLEVTTVDSYDDIPDTSNLIEISSSDISQGTGNVIVYTYMNAGDGSLYRYASF